MRRLATAVLLALALAIGPWLASAPTSWWVIGDLSERNGYTTIIDLPQTAAAAHVAAATGLSIAVGSIAVGRWVRQRFVELPGSASVMVVVAVVFGIATGFSFRLVSSRSYGADIGGGGLLLWPTMALLLAAYGAVVLRRMTNQVVRDPHA